MKQSIYLAALPFLAFGMVGCTANPVQNSTVSESTTAVAESAAVSPAETAPPETAAQADPEQTDAVTEQTTTVLSSAPAEAASDPPAETTITAAPAQTAQWKAAYKETLLQFKESENYCEQSAWDLQDLDQDGIPELLISEAQYHVTGVAYYYYENGSVSPVLDENGDILHLGSYGAVLVCPEEHLLGDADMHMGYFYSAIFRYENHNITKVLVYSENSGAVGDENVTYTVNDEAVSQEAYQEAQDSFNAKDWKDAGLKYSFDDFSALEA